MRLYKKAAVCLLAAAMSLTMLTACGGGGSTGGGNAGGGTSTVEPAPKPDDVVLPGDKEEGKGDTEEPTKIAIVPSKSKLAAYSNKIAGASELYVVGDTAVYDASNTQVSETATTMARKDGNVYIKTTQKDETVELLFDKTEKNTYDEYILLSADHVAAKIESDIPAESVSSLTNPTVNLPAQIWATKVKVGGTEYYAETFTENGAEYTDCFGTDGMLKYQFVKSGSTTVSSVYSTTQVGTGVSRNLCKIPAGTKTYREAEYNGQPVMMDESGNVYTVNYVTDEENHKVLSYTVTDKDGKDVTKDFAWMQKLADLLY